MVFRSLVKTNTQTQKSRLRSEVQHLQSTVDASRGEINDLKRRNAQIERELATVAASDHTQSIALPSSKSYASAFPVKENAALSSSPQPVTRRMQESRIANALPTPSPASTSPTKHAAAFDQSRPRTLSTEGPYGGGYGGVHAARSEFSIPWVPPPPSRSTKRWFPFAFRKKGSIDLKRGSLQFAPPPAGPNSPRRRNYE